MQFLSRLLNGNRQDPYWERFVNRPPADPGNDLTTAFRSAPGGATYPVKTEVSDPSEMSRNLKQFATFLGARALGIAAFNQLPASPSSPEEVRPASTEQSAAYPSRIVVVVPSQYDSREAKGFGGQFAVQEAARITFQVGSFIRELGYQTAIGGTSSEAVALASGVVGAGPDGQADVKGLWLGDVIQTDLPLAPDVTSRV